MIAPIVTAAAFAALGAAEEVAWSGFDRWSYNSYSELGTKQANYYPEFFKNNVSSTEPQSNSCSSCTYMYQATWYLSDIVVCA
jgi:hypothetical protein